MNREPARDKYDAVVGLASSYDRVPYVFALAKFTYSIEGTSCRLDAPEPLLHDFRDETLEPRLRPGTDFWPRKDATDFVVRGSAYAPGGSAVPHMTVSAQVGGVRKDIAVFGRRMIEWASGSLRSIAPPEPFDRMPLTYENAYGGLDWRVPVEDADTLTVRFLVDTDHPAMYPRNPVGKGYLVEPGEVPDMEMPNLEDPSDLLTPGRLIVGDPRQWYRQPLPWCFDWVRPVTFPRYVFFSAGVDAWFPGPEDGRMPEVKRGFLVEGYRGEMASRSMEQGPDPRFRQEASYGLVLPEIKGDEPVVLTGMHPHREALRFALPGADVSLEIGIEGKSERVRPRLHSVVCYPDQERVTMLYGGWVDLPRPFIPGIHKHIPVSVRVNGDEPIHYEAPPLLKDQLAEAMAKLDPEETRRRT